MLDMKDLTACNARSEQLKVEEDIEKAAEKQQQYAAQG